jgi:hypothetical protein
MTCNYQYRIQQYRLLHELFDKFQWSQESLRTLEKMHGLSYTTIATYPDNVDWKKVVQELESDATPTEPIKEPTFEPVRTIKGF